MLFLLVFKTVHEREASPTGQTERADREASPWHRRFLFAAWVANFASWFIMGNARFQFPKLARELNLSPHLIGLVLGFLGLALFSGFFLLRRTDRWFFVRNFLLSAQVLALAGVLLITVSNDAVLFALAFVMIGLSCSVTYYSSLYYAVHLLKKKGKGSGLHESILGGGAVLGPILGGVAAQYAGLRAPYVLCMGVLVAAFATVLALLKKADSRASGACSRG
jgi:MFS family permease